MSKENFLKNIISKDNNLSIETIKNMINSSNIEEFRELIEKSDFIFPFLKTRIKNDFIKLIKKENLDTLIEFSKYYSPDFEDMIVSSLIKLYDENSLDSILDLLENGNINQKTYAAKYFSIIHDELSIIELKKNLKIVDNLNLKINSIEALKGFNNSDEFEKLNSLENIFLFNPSDKKNIEYIFSCAKSSPFILNIVSLIIEYNDFYSMRKILDDKEIKNIYQILLENYPENLSLDTISFYQIIEVIKYLKKEIDNYSKLLLLKTYKDFIEYNSIESYTFDLDKDTKFELKNITKELENIDFIKNKQDDFILEELKNHNIDTFNLVLDIIKDDKNDIYFDILIELINNNDLIQSDLIKSLTILKEHNKISKINRDIIENINDYNAKEICLELLN